MANVSEVVTASIIRSSTKLPEGYVFKRFSGSLEREPEVSLPYSQKSSVGPCPVENPVYFVSWFFLVM
jgi:hypothetical protein